MGEILTQFDEELPASYWNSYVPKSEHKKYQGCEFGHNMISTEWVSRAQFTVYIIMGCIECTPNTVERKDDWAWREGLWVAKTKMTFVDEEYSTI